MNKAFRSDIWRSARHAWKRFLSILIITALGVGMMTGLYAACMDLYRSTDRFFQEQGLFDIRILSTLGLTDEDIQALAAMDGVQAAEGGYSETVYTQAAGARKDAEMSVLSSVGLNRPFVLSGRLPQHADEIAVTPKYLEDSGKAIGETLTIEEDIEPSGVTPSQPSSSKKEDLLEDIELEVDTEIEEEEEPTFPNTTFTITGVVLDPQDIQSRDGNASAYRTTATADYTFYVLPEAAKNDVYTLAYLLLRDAADKNSFYGEYQSVVSAASIQIEETLKSIQEQHRYDSVMAQALEKIQDAERTMYEQFATADEKIADAWQEISDGKAELADGRVTLDRERRNARRKIADAKAELEQGRFEILDAEYQISQGEEKLAQAEEEIAQNEQDLAQGKRRLSEESQYASEQFAAADKQFRGAQGQLDQARAQLEPAAAQMQDALGPAFPQNEWKSLVDASAALAAGGADDAAIAAQTAQQSADLAAALPGPAADQAVQIAVGLGKVNGSQAVLDAQLSAFNEQKEEAHKAISEAEDQLSDGEYQLKKARETIQEEKRKLTHAKIDVHNGKIDLANGEAELAKSEADARQKFEDAQKEIDDAAQELADGEAELIEQEQEYAQKKADALKKLDEAYAKLDDIGQAQWYIQDRTALESYSGLQGDLSSIEAVGNIFPIIFLLVAVLVSLTTMTRMVEEERGLIGTYKALGFGNGAIYLKYMLFAFMACLFGGALGDVIGFIMFPRLILVIMKEMYIIPKFALEFHAGYGVGSVLVFMAGILIATALACRNELSQVPAALMRPKAPKVGTRVFLERITFLWNRLGFLRKVTVRNLFRYKKRLFMTVGGIMGCTALILCGFAIKDSIAGLAPKQYDTVYHYDLMAVFDEDDYEEMTGRLISQGEIERPVELRIENIKLLNERGKAEKVQLIVVPQNTSLADYIRLETLDQTLAQPEEEGVLITQNAAKMLGLNSGSTASLQNTQLAQRDTSVSAVVKNYLGNSVYISQRHYESLFGDYEPNGILAFLPPDCEDHAAYAQSLLEDDGVLSAVSTKALKADFSFDLINGVVLLLTVMAGGLAFVVLFTLSSTNISERVRELATIKVLGFYDPEVHHYINRETIILSVLGMLLGLPLGRLISELLTVMLNIPSIHFSVTIQPVSYAISAALTLCFTLVVNLMTNRALNRIDMVEALKSVE